MPDVISATATSDIPRLAEMDRSATGTSGNALSVAALAATGLSTLTGGLAPNKGFPGTAHPVSSSLNAHLTSATVTGHDCAGSIVLVVDGTGIAQNQTLCVITFANASLYTNVPVVTLTNMTSGASSTTLHSGTYGSVTVSATAFSVVVLGAALTASATLTMGYIITGTG